MTLPLGRRRSAPGFAAAAFAALIAVSPALAKTPASDDRGVASRYGAYLSARHAETIAANASANVEIVRFVITPPG